MMASFEVSPKRNLLTTDEDPRQLHACLRVVRLICCGLNIPLRIINMVATSLLVTHGVTRRRSVRSKV